MLSARILKKNSGVEVSKSFNSKQIDRLDSSRLVLIIVVIGMETIGRKLRFVKNSHKYYTMGCEREQQFPQLTQARGVNY